MTTAPLHFHLSSTASSPGDGSTERPFASFPEARDALRALRRAGKLRAPVRVLIAPGLYRLSEPLVFTPEDGGTEDCPVTWAGSGGLPILSGARAISGWRKGKINGHDCWQAQLPEVAAGRWWFTQLFVNGQRRLRARLPKTGFYRFSGVPKEEAKRDPGTGFIHPAMSARFAPGQLGAFSNLSDAEVVVPDHFWETHLRVAAIDTATNTLHLETRGLSRLSRDEQGQPARYCLNHVPEACSEPGEWYLDRATGTLSYIPIQGEKPEESQVEAPLLERVLEVRGEAMDSKKRVRHLRFEFLDLRHTDWELPRENPGPTQASFMIPAAVRLVGAQDCAFYGCHISQVAGWAIEVMRGCTRTRILACCLFDLGGGGVRIAHEGGVPTRPGSYTSLGAFGGLDPVALGWGPCCDEPGGTLPGRDRVEASATTVADCSIHDGGKIFYASCGVWIGDASQNRVLHNHIYNFTYCAVSCGWSWGYAPVFAADNHIEGNRIHDIGQDLLADFGAIYTLGRQAGTRIHRNVIRNTGRGCPGIYLDEGSSWVRVEGNAVFNCGSHGVLQHVGRDNLIRGNLFAGSRESLMNFCKGEMFRSARIENNYLEGAGNGGFWNITTGYQHLAWKRAAIDGNAYAPAPGQTAPFAGQTWAQWQADGYDRRSHLVEADRALPQPADPSALSAAGIDPERLAATLAEAGPRPRAGLYANIDELPAPVEAPQRVVEPFFWPWAEEYPLAMASKLPNWWRAWTLSAPIAIGLEQSAHLSLLNKGQSPAHGRYRIRVAPACAARILGEETIAFSLKPGERSDHAIRILATGEPRAFWIEVEAEGEDLANTALYYESFLFPPCEVPCHSLHELPSPDELAEALAALPLEPVAGKGRPIEAGLRLAQVAGHLLVRIDSADAELKAGDKIWNGSSAELFVASERGAAHTQLLLAPALFGAAAIARRVSGGEFLAVEGLKITGGATDGGWMLALMVPLSALGLPADGSGWVVDVAVNATPPGAAKPARAHLASERNPCFESTYYAKVV